jgi:hypothetical protein
MLSKIIDDDALAGSLHAAGPFPGLENELMTFGQFVGSWDLTWEGTSGDLAGFTAHGQVHFGWVLGGRAVQDVWIMPGPGAEGYGVPGRSFHGTTLRFYDPALGAWRSTWIEPINGRVRRFVGRAEGDDIVLVSLDAEPLLRWRFTEVTGDSFTWLGEHSTDEARTWVLDERMLARRSREP